MALSKYDKARLRKIAGIQRMVEEIYSEAVKEAARLGESIGGVDFDKVFSFDDYPAARKKLKAILDKLGSQLGDTILKGIDDAWALSNKANDAMLKQLLGGSTAQITQKQYNRYTDPNTDARVAFSARSEGGMTISDRVWKYTEQFRNEIEMGIDIGLRDGLPAAEMARDLKKYLQRPEMLFRRVRDEHGILHLSKRAKEYHPGQGVYRSSYKNAMRLARTEVNVAYHEADHARWQNMDFVLGIEIFLSNNHTCLGADGKPHPFTDICDELAGQYPKDFKFTGWHPMCRCSVKTILKTLEEMAADKKALREGRQPEQNPREVKELPPQFKRWMENNADRISAAEARGTLPYFIRDNEKMLWPERYMEMGQTQKPLTALERAEIRHAARTPEQVEAIKQRWQEREDNMALSSAIGIEQGKQMTFDEANEMRGNPHYAEDVQFRVNCQSAVVANELRRQGWDVEAFGNTKAVNTTPLALSKMTEAAWLDTDGNIPKPISVKQATSSDVYVDARGSIRTKHKMKSNADFLKEFQEATSEEGRYHISWTWKGKSKGGHIVTAERLSDGKLRIYDPQNGKITAIRLKDINTADGFKILRVDNLRPNVDVIRGVVKPALSSASTPIMDAGQKELWKKTLPGRKVYSIVDGSKLTEFKKSIRKDINRFPTKEVVWLESIRTGKLVRKNESRARFINHCKNRDAIAAAEYVWNHPDKIKFVRSSELGEVKKMNNPADVRNIQKKVKRGVDKYNIYEVEFRGVPWIVYVEEFQNKTEQLYAIYEKKRP